MANRWARKMKTTIKGILAAVRNGEILSRGQTLSDSILQLSHRLEKGLTVHKPKAMWGWDKANELVQLLEKEENTSSSFAYQTGTAVLYAYLEAKKQTGVPEEQVKSDALLAVLQKKGIILQNPAAGGALELNSGNVELSDDEFAAAQKLFLSRHSIRDYADTEVSQKSILKAVELAGRCPSACNRQPYHVYVVQASDRARLGFKNELNANKYIIVTGRISAFKLSELNDWIVSATVFASYLSLALHACGIGSCIMRKDLVNETNYNKLMRDFCGIPGDEQIVLELAVGYYKDTFRVPVSNRMPAESVVSFIDGKGSAK